MTKYFTLFSGKEVRSAPGTKIVPADEAGTLLSATEVLEQVKHDAEAFRKETAVEAEKTKEKAYADGFAQGLESFNAHLLKLDQELKQIRHDVHEKILPLALKAARKIVGEELALHPDRIVDIVLNSLKPVTQHRKVVVYLHPDDLERVEKSKSKIKQMFDHLESLSLQGRDDVERGGCVIETEAGIINAQLETQWRALEQAFEAFKGKR